MDRVLCCVLSGWLVCSSATAFVLTGQDWSYQTNPMDEDWHACGTGMPGMVCSALRMAQRNGITRVLPLPLEPMRVYRTTSIQPTIM